MKYQAGYPGRVGAVVGGGTLLRPCPSPPASLSKAHLRVYSAILTLAGRRPLAPVHVLRRSFSCSWTGSACASQVLAGGLALPFASPRAPPQVNVPWTHAPPDVAVKPAWPPGPAGAILDCLGQNLETLAVRSTISVGLPSFAPLPVGVVGC